MLVRTECADTRAEVWLRKKPVDMCSCEIEECEDGVSAGANATVKSDTLQSKGLTECANTRAKVWLWKKTHGPVYMRERGV